MHRAAVGGERGHTAERHGVGGADAIGDLDDHRGERGPADRRLGPPDDDEIAPESTRPQLDLGPFDRAHPAVDEMDRGAHLLEVEEVGEIDRAEALGAVHLVDERVDGPPARDPGVDPAAERIDEHGIGRIRPALHLQHPDQGTARPRAGSRRLRPDFPRYPAGMDVKFGVHTGLQNTSIAELQGLWRRIEDLGFDWISIWDHFYAADATGNPHSLEAVVAHAALAATTSRVQCGSLVYSAGYRHPAVIANAMATLDQLAEGRVVLGLGGGWLRNEYDVYGIEYGTAGQRLRRLEESLCCIRSLLTQPRSDFDGEFFTLRDAQCEPKPVQARLPIWVGGGGEKVTLRIAAQHADGWNVPFIAPDAWAHKARVLDAHCERLGRDPGEITKTVNVGMAFTDEELRDQFGRMAEAVRPGVFTGSVQQMVDQAAAYCSAGARYLILALRAPFDRDGLERFAAEVVPAIRAA